MNYLSWVLAVSSVAVLYTIVAIRSGRKTARFVEGFLAKWIEVLEASPGTHSLIYLSYPSDERVGFHDNEMDYFIWRISRPKPTFAYVSGGKPLTMTLKHEGRYFQMKPGSKAFGLAEKLFETIRTRQEEGRTKDELIDHR